MLKLSRKWDILFNRNRARQSAACNKRGMLMMRPNDRLHGFILRYVQPLEEINATLYRMEYEKNGADLVWLKREDSNKTFSIGFKTLPTDDTGVFHIIEHSVLNGSEKYPTKEPFVELIKSSLQTFLNAMTFPDKTMYPLSSRNDKDFLNLIDVYMDAVLHPLSIVSDLSFLQEGWHYELDSPKAELSCNGVVYNEMKGAFASADSEMEYRLLRALFPDNCYGFESGGHPDHITELTYENYVASHARYYHPSNSRIFLDGDMDIDAVLMKLDSFLRDYDPIDPAADIPMQQPVTAADGVFSYEISPEDEAPNRAIFAQGWVWGDYSMQDEKMGANILRHVLCGSNEAPLKKALLDAGLCEDVTLDGYGMQQNCTFLVLRNAKPEDKDKIWQTVESVLREQADKGLDREQLVAAFNRLEFQTREKDFGSMPRGLAYAIGSMDSWLYGGDPADELCCDEVFARLRKGMDEGWFENLLRRTMLDNPHRARICLLPSTTLGEEKRKAERSRLEAVKAQWDEEMCRRVMDDFGRLRLHQETPDTPQQLATLPLLSLSDISPEIQTTPQIVDDREGVTLLRHPIETQGIDYLTLYFSLEDMPLEEISKLSFMSALLGKTETLNCSRSKLRSRIDSELGRFSAVLTYATDVKSGKCRPYLMVVVSVLHSRRDKALELLEEILLNSVFTDRDFVARLLRQRTMSMEQDVIMAGNSFGSYRVAASFSGGGAVRENIMGISYVRWLQEHNKSFAQEGEALCDEFARLCRRIFVRDRLLMSMTGPADESFADSIINIFPRGEMGEAAVYSPMPVAREGFTVPADIGFAVRGANLRVVDSEYSGALYVASQYLTFDYLWNAVRVKGGAYGTRMSAAAAGDVSFTSYRDPSAANSLAVYAGAGDALRSLCASGEALDRYIISTVGDSEPVTSPYREGANAALRYLSGIDDAMRCRTRSQILSTTREDILAVADMLDALMEKTGVCVIGGKEVLDACDLDKVESLQQ